MEIGIILENKSRNLKVYSQKSRTPGFGICIIANINAKISYITKQIIAKVSISLSKIPSFARGLD